VYAGDSRVVIDADAQENEQQTSLARERMEAFQSPLDFFNPDLDNYPNYEEVDRKYTVIIHEGDCIFVPAFYFHQYIAKSSASNDASEMAIIVSLKYKGNSAILSAFIEGVEQKFIS